MEIFIPFRKEEPIALAVKGCEEILTSTEDQRV